MLTYQNIYQEAQEQLGDTSAPTKTVIVQALNQGKKKFAAVMRRDWYNTEKTFSLVADQQYYRMPEDCVRMKGLLVTIGSTIYPLEEIANEEQWRILNTSTTTSDRPRFFFVRGADEYGIWPTPSSSSSNAGRLIYQRRQRNLSTDNYTTGTVTLTNASAAVVGDSTTFTALMVNRYLKADDPSGDGVAYKIASFTSTTSIALDNTYGGTTASGLSYVIGEAPDIPEEYHESLVDYALYRCYLRRRDVNTAKELKSLFDESLSNCKEQYGSKTTSNYTRARKHRYPSIFNSEPGEVT